MSVTYNEHQRIAYRRNEQTRFANRRRKRAQERKQSVDAYIAEREAKLAQMMAVADVSWNPKTGKMEIKYSDRQA